MPRGKKTVYGMYCKETGEMLGVIRISKSKKADFRPLEKYSPTLRKRVEVKVREMKHSS